MKLKKEVAVFGGGCFWCTEAIFQELKGVESVVPGYAGGTPAAGKEPTYEEVCTGATGHAEVIKIEFDPEQISFKDLLTVFFATHDPTTLNRQGADIGTQYRSIILYTSPGQKSEAEEFIREINRSAKEGMPIVTEIKPLEKFYPAEAYHDDYYRKNPHQPYCEVVINPKLQKLQKQFSQLLKSRSKNNQ